MAFVWAGCQNLRQFEKSLKSYEKHIVSLALPKREKTGSRWCTCDIFERHCLINEQLKMSIVCPSQSEKKLAYLRDSCFGTPFAPRFIDGTEGFGHAHGKLQCKRQSSIAWNSGHKVVAKGYATNAANAKD